MTWKLVGISEGIVGQSMLLDRDILIGRHQQADLVLQSAQVSRRHAGIEYRADDQSIWIEDLGSSNGTFVNGKQIQQATQLKHGDEIRFQDIIFQVQYDAVAQPSTDDGLSNQRPSDDGMPTLQERSVDVQVRADGTPQAVAIPKPAPIPEHIDIHAPQPIEPTPSPSPSIDPEHAKNAKAGIITWIIIVVAIVIAMIAFLR